MAKKKTAKSSEAPAATRTAPPKKVVAKPTPAERALSSLEVGNTAGEVWQSLAEGGPQSLAALKKQVAAPADLVTAAVGWLAREGKLSFRTSGRTVLLELRDES